MKKNTKRGFTLIELLVASTILIVLATIGIVSFTNAGRSARDAKRKADLETVRAALVQYKVDTGSYPTSANYSILTGVSGPLVSGGYLSQPVPVDPKNTGTFMYVYTPSGGTGFTLTADLEKTGEPNYVLRNP